jgi:hypothetical protein
MEKLINKKKIDLACGQNKQPGFFGIDKVMIKGKVDAAVDLQLFPWPIKSNSAEEIFCSHYVEHIPHDAEAYYLKTIFEKAEDWREFKILQRESYKYRKDGLILFFEELCRIMKKGATAKIICPYESSIRCWQDPTHVRAMNEASLMYFNEKWIEQNNLSHMDITCDIDYSFGYDYLPDWTVKVQDQKDFAARHYRNIIADIHYVLTKR